MNKFGQIKSKIVSKLTDLYSKQDKKKIKETLSLIKEDKDFVETYLLYENIENKYFSDEQTAKFYVEELSKSLNGKSKKLKNTLKKLDKSVGLVETKYQPIYDYLDTLLEEDNLLNIESKVKSKIELVEHLTKKKEIVESRDSNYSNNENLLYAVLSNNFNVLYSNTLNENEKTELKSILSLTQDEIIKEVPQLKESINKKVEKILSESVDSTLIEKLKSVKSEVHNMEPSRVNYFKLKQLENGLD